MNRIKITLLIVLIITFSGCAGMGYIAPPRTGGAYHKVRKGETLWRISKYYGVGIGDIASANRLPDKRKIYVGQLLFIPGGIKQAAPPHSELLEEKSFIWPVKGTVVSFYGSIEDSVKNKGIDIKVRRGVSVRASRSGTISFLDENMKGFGKTVIIDHGDGFSTVYAHNAKILVGVGQKVTKKTIIAKAGDTGRARTPRLHFEIRKNKVPKNPFYYLP